MSIKIPAEPPPRVDTGKTEEHAQYQAKFDKLEGITKSLTDGLSNLKISHYGFTVVTFLGFLALLWAAYTFFGSTTESYRAEIKNLSDKYYELRIGILEKRVDSVEAKENHTRRK